MTRFCAAVLSASTRSTHFCNGDEGEFRRANSCEPRSTCCAVVRRGISILAQFGFISFGGPTAQIALLHGELVEKKKWISESRFFHALNFCMLLPGPEAHQLAIYIGWLLHKIRGGVIAGTLFVLPAAVFLWGLTWVYAAYGNIAWAAAIFFGIKPAVMAIVAEA